MRTLIHEVVADIDDAASETVLIVHWVSGAGSAAAPLPNFIEAVRHLVLLARDDLIAVLLNRNGFKTGNGNRWMRDPITLMR